MTKVELAKDWIKYLSTEEPGEWELDQQDMNLIKEALQVWLNHLNLKPTIQVIVNGVTYEVK